MYDELFPDARSASLGQILQRPVDPATPPGVWRGFGSAVADALPYAANTSASAWSAVLDAYGHAAAYRDTPTNARVNGETAPDAQALQAQTLDRMGDSDTARMFRARAKDYTPDPAAVGLAGQVAHGLMSGLVKMGAYATAGPAGPLLFGLDTGINRAQALTDQGVDEGTAAAAGLVSGVSGAAMMIVPPALGATRLQSAAIGAGVAPAMTVAEVGGIRALLEHADYEKIAAQYQPFDPLDLSIAALTGAAFGGVFHRAKADPTPRLTPDEHAALLTMNEVRIRDGDTLTVRGDLAAAADAHDAQALARQQLDRGERVSVAERIKAETGQLLAAWDRVHENPVGPKDDPLVVLTPEHIGEVLVERGDAWLGKDGLTVKTGREGLVKIVVRHGPDSSDPHPVTREEVASLPVLIREYEPMTAAGTTGMQERVWVIPREEGGPLVIVVKESARDAQNRLVTMYSDLKNPDRPTSAKRQGPRPESAPPSRASHAAEDTAPETSSRSPGSQEASLDSNIAQPGILDRVRDAVSSLLGRHERAATAAPVRRLDTPEQARAAEIAARSPDAMIRLEDGSEVRMADLLAHADSVEATATAEKAAFEAAVTCAIRFPQ